MLKSILFFVSHNIIGTLSGGKSEYCTLDVLKNILAYNLLLKSVDNSIAFLK